MSQATNDHTEKVVPLHRPIPMTEAERSAKYRARQRLKKVKRGSPKGVTKRVTRDGQKLVTQTVTDTASRDAKSPVTPSVTVPVDLIALRREIQDWTKLHAQVERLRTGREPYNPRMWFLAMAVAFFALVAYSAAVPA